MVITPACVADTDEIAARARPVVAAPPPPDADEPDSGSRPMPTCSAIAAVMIHVPDVGAALAWYQQAFPRATRATVAGTDFECLSLDGIQLELVPSDEKVGAGASGSVVYWRVGEFERALTRLQGLGAVLYRGPMPIEAGLTMCQVRDPWGNCIGIRGPDDRGARVPGAGQDAEGAL